MNVPVINHLASLVIARALAESVGFNFDNLEERHQNSYIDTGTGVMKALEDTGWRLVPYGPNRKGN